MKSSEIAENLQNITSKVEPYWTIVGAPVTQEFVFRFLPYRIYLIYGGFYELAIVSALSFSAIHWYFGKQFMIFSLLWGLIFWWVIVYYGFVAAVALHVFINFILWRSDVLSQKIIK